MNPICILRIFWSTGHMDVQPLYEDNVVTVRRMLKFYNSSHKQAECDLRLYLVSRHD